MLQVGITGGIGAGKSLVAKIFMILGIPAYNADDRAKWLMNHNPNLQSKIIDLFGEDSYQGGNLNRKYLAEQVFPNPELLKKLNAIVHPAVEEDYHRWVSFQKQKGCNYTLKEAALLFETGSYKKLDYTILVHASEKTRIKRVLNRDPHRNHTQVKEIMQKQLPEEQKLKKADFIINNEPDQMVIQQVLEINNTLIKLAK